MTLNGESKSGLSTYYIKFCHGKNVFDHILDRIGQMDSNESSSVYIICFIKSLKKEWQNHYELLTWEYGKHHLKQSDMDILHCCMFTLGGNCEHSNKENSYVECLTCF